MVSFVFVLTSEKDYTKDPDYASGFFVGILGFLEGLLFAFFTYEMVTECTDILDSNQTYVDDLKSLYGKPMSRKRALPTWLGKDKLFWLLPTRPVISLNYME